MFWSFHQNSNPNAFVTINFSSLVKFCRWSYYEWVGVAKAMVFPVVMYGYKSWTIKKAEHWRVDAFELWCFGEDSWESLGLHGDHWLDGHEFEQILGVGDGQGGLVCRSPRGHRVGHDWATELNWGIAWKITGPSNSSYTLLGGVKYFQVGET